MYAKEYRVDATARPRNPVRQILYQANIIGTVVVFVQIRLLLKRMQSECCNHVGHGTCILMGS